MAARSIAHHSVGRYGGPWNLRLPNFWRLLGELGLAQLRRTARSSTVGCGGWGLGAESHVFGARIWLQGPLTSQAAVSHQMNMA